jgi:hypothetical protein
MKAFDLEKWVEKLRGDVWALGALQSFAANSEALTYHVALTQMLTDESETDEPPVLDGDVDVEILEYGFDIEDVEAVELAAEDYQKDVQRAVEIHMRQMIVLVVTYVEGIILEFMECLFTKHPARMYAYLFPRQERGLRGKVDLKDILGAESKEALVASLTRRAASIATQGSFQATVNSLEKVSKSELDASLLGDIASLVGQRNRIVHEASSEEVGEERVRQGFRTAVNLLRELVSFWCKTIDCVE